ncbi:MAG: hypothetical protein FWD61_13585 [Phycisphaerales bacterium]|nr:hypothetical protein [Phycisphaerales bacterium]
MKGIDLSGWCLVITGGVIMAMVLLRAISQGSVLVAVVMIDDRRRKEAQRKADNAAAEAAGRAAAMEPLNLNPDGTIEEPILAAVEGSQN